MINCKIKIIGLRMLPHKLHYHISITLLLCRDHMLLIDL